MAETDLPDKSLLFGIELLVLDVDGVLTDGRITLTPEGEEIKSFHAKDGAGMKYWKRVGKKLAVISGRGSPVVTRRAAELGVDVVRLNAKDKLPVYLEVLSETGLNEHQVAVMGDDLTDLPMMARCALPLAAGDAAEEVKSAAAYVSKLPGGAGCVREVIEMILRTSGLWDQVVARYLVER